MTIQHETYTKRNEGCVLKLYKCTNNKNTIAYGFNLDDNPIPQFIADLLYDWVAEQVVKDLKRIFSDWNGLSSTRQTVLFDMCYQLGLTRFLKFKKTIKAVQQEDFEKASEEILDSDYARDKHTGPRATHNAALMLSNEYTPFHRS